jgi:hypothetical protein
MEKIFRDLFRAFGERLAWDLLQTALPTPFLRRGETFSSAYLIISFA